MAKGPQPENSKRKPGTAGLGRAKVTINDIARLSGVSKKTVSRVINNSPQVREETRKKVKAIILEHGFTPDPQARALALRRSYLVGMIYDNPSPQYIVNMQRGILDVLSDTSYQLVLRPCDRTDSDFYEKIETFITLQKPYGVILTPSVSEDEDLANMLREMKCDYVRIASVELDKPTKMVRTHDFKGAAQAAQHIASLGHERIAHIHGPNTFRSAHQRRHGFEHGLEICGLKLAKSLTLEGAYTFDSGYECAQKLFAMKSPPTAVFAGNDEMAVGVYQAARQVGMQVPKDITIVGFDDTPVASRVWPPMTTVRLPIRDMGRAAASLLLNPHDEDRPESFKDGEIISFEPELIVRGSTARISKK